MTADVDIVVSEQKLQSDDHSESVNPETTSMMQAETDTSPHDTAVAARTFTCQLFVLEFILHVMHCHCVLYLLNAVVNPWNNLQHNTVDFSSLRKSIHPFICIRQRGL